MTYELTWHESKKALWLTLSGDYLLEEAKALNQEILDELEKSQTPLLILIDATHMNRSYRFSDIRTAQTFMDHLKLKAIYVATNDRLVKLSMLIIFNLSRASLYVCDDVEKATLMLQKQLTVLR